MSVRDRIRDGRIDGMFRFLLLAVLSTPVVCAAAGDPVAGKQFFMKCASCHQVTHARSSFGPHLNGIINRPAAAATDYKYSEAMRKSGIVWSEDKLRAFLKAPDKLVPGNAMRFTGISSDSEIDDLLAYLRKSR